MSVYPTKPEGGEAPTTQHHPGIPSGCHPGVLEGESPAHGLAGRGGLPWFADEDARELEVRRQAYGKRDSRRAGRDRPPVLPVRAAGPDPEAGS